MKKTLRSISLGLIAVLLAFTTLTVNVSANEKEIYTNKDKSIGIEVERLVSGDEIELQFKKVKNEDINYDITSIKINEENLDLSKNSDFLYSHIVGENGDYKYTVEYTRYEKLDDSNHSSGVNSIKESFDFTLIVREIELKEKKVKSDESIEKTTINESNVIQTDDENEEPKVAYFFPNSGEVKEYSIDEIKTYAARSTANVTVGEKILGSTTFYWKQDPSYSFSFPTGFSEIYVNGEVGYCIEPSVMKVATGSATAQDLETIEAIWVLQGKKSQDITRVQQERITLIANYGAQFPGHNTKAFKGATQILIFETLGWVVNTSTDLSYEKNEIMKLVNSHTDVPSWTGDILEVRLGEIVDLSNDLNPMFTIIDSTGLTIIEDSGSSLKVRVDSKNASLTMEKKRGIETGTSFVYSDGSSQKVGSFKINDPVLTFIDFEVKSHTQRVFKEGENGEPLSGHKFRMSYVNTVDANGILSGDANNNVWDYVTGSDGYTPTDTWNNEGQTVYVQEIEAQDPYIRNTEIKSFVVTPGAETTISFKNEKAQGQFSINKYDNHGQRAIAKYNILNASNTVVGSVVTSLTGEVKSNILPLGKYKLQEISVNGNLVLNPEIIDVELKYKDQVTPVVLLSKDFVNNYQRGDINLTKIEDTSDKFNPEYHGTKLEGIEFGLVAKADTYEGSTLVYRAGEIIGKEVTNSVGQLKFHNVAIGEYALRELKTIEGYQLLDHDVDVSIAYDSTNNTVEITQHNQTVENSPILGNVELVKANGTGNQRLEGGVFDLYRGDKKLGTYTSDKNGRIVVEGLRYSTGNTYKFIETKAPGGYWLNADPIYFDVTEQGETVYLIAPNNLIEVHVEWNKTNEDGLPLEGVGFKIRNTDTNEFVTVSHADGKEVIDENIWYTGKDGSVFIKGKMTAGNYELVEVAPLEGYQPIAPVKFTIDDQQTYIDLGTLVGLSLNVGEIVNYWNRGNIKVGKIDEDTKEFLQGFGFNVYNSKGEFIGYHETGDDGTFTLEDVRYGLYTIEEVKVNGDYGIDPTKNKQEIFVEEHGKTYELIFENKHTEIKTKASFVERDQKEPNMVTTSDIVFYSNAWVGKEYEVEGFLMIKETNKPLLINGELVKASKKFTPTEKDGFVELFFTFDATYLEGQTTVAFETLKRDGITVYVHHDINDIDQSVKLPEGKTKASFTSRDLSKPNFVTLSDETFYYGLTVGVEKEIKTYLRDQVTGLPIIIDGEKVWVTNKFTPTEPNGSVITSVTVDMNKLNTTRVNFAEYVYEEGRLIFFHDDLDDENQSLDIITIRIDKVDSETDVRLKDAGFSMYDLDGNLLDSQDTNEEGIATFRIFEGETVELKETRAPEGYLRSDEVIRVTGTKGIDGNLYTIVYPNDLMPVIVLPATGISNSPIITISIFLVLFGIALVLFNRKNSIQFVTSSAMDYTPVLVSSNSLKQSEDAKKEIEKIDEVKPKKFKYGRTKFKKE